MKPTWIVFVYNDKLQAAKQYRGDKEDIVGYVTCNKAKDAIDYAESMGFSNHHRTDCTPMAPWQRGEILYWYQQKLTLLAIAEKVNRSIDWVSIVCGITGRSRDELISLYQQHMEDQEDAIQESILSSRRRSRELQTNGKKKVGSRVSGTSNGNTDRRYNSRKTKRTVSKRTTTRRPVTIRTKQPDNTSVRTGKQGIVDSLRKSKDYVGD